MASTRYSRDPEPASEPRGRGPLGVLTLLLALYSAVVASILLFRPAPGASGGGDPAETGPLNERFDAQARKLRTETADDVDKRLREHTEKLAAAAKRVEDAGKSVQAVADSAVKRADETARGAGARVENLDEKVEDLSKTVTSIRGTLDSLTLQVRALESRPVAVAPVAGPPPPVAGPTPPAPTPAPTGTPPEAPSDAPLTPEQIAANKEKVKAAIADLSTGDLTKVYTAAIFLGKAGDLEAAEPLMKVLKEFKDSYGRTAAALALGRLHACDAVPTLLSMFTEKNGDVFLASAQAFAKISGLDSKLSGDATRGEKKKAQEEWTHWWKDHEAEMRKKWGQEKVEEPAPTPPAMGEPGK